MNRIGVILILIFITAGHSVAQSDRQRRRQLNFENVGIKDSVITFEQRLYRNPFIGLIEIKQAYPDAPLTHFIPLFQGIPVAKYKIDGHDLTVTDLKSGDYQHRTGFLYHFKNNYKADFWLQPYFNARFGNFDKPVESNTSIGLQSQLFLLPGLTFHFGILFPILNDMDNRPKKIRPTPLFFNYFNHWQNHFISASGGYFYEDQAGINIQYQYADLGKPVSFGLEAGLTSDYYYATRGVYYGGFTRFLLQANAAYRLKKLDLTFKASGGRYIAGDYGGRIDLIRQFTRIEIGLYAATTTNGSTIGFNSAFPIPPGKIFQGKKARLRTTDEFAFEYSYTRGYRIGQRYRTGYRLDQKLRQYHQYYLNNQYQQISK